MPLALVFAVVAVFAFSAAPAHAQILVRPAYNCPPETLERPFAPWADDANYVLVGDGGFEGGASGWQRSRAIVVEGNQPLNKRAATDAHALELAPGGTAKSPEICVGLHHPSLRFFVRKTGSPLGSLAVEVVVTTVLGLRIGLPVGLLVSSGGGWAPSPPMPVLANLLALGGRTRVALRFTSLGLSTWEIDDVYVDPYSKG
ncbi:hypothetical protein DVA67_014995 [Solirubrobacter sp. CPCC 204708]|uniref:Uncharacterized protein n=1 Tax=Solirubrobacter deserti TaxID=2282478 RepID=A0ABT4RKP7_9ACTN|nr:hypothetical protein [Solirubrobacter deserti]MBE2317287.1 hypothetical protein [Solirubrobacter deserti]MDA0139018.1 hypothetical protein [Solirubrobacter deserti]